MGAWGTGNFDNDDALDWVWDFEAQGPAALEQAFEAVLDADYAEAPDASSALAAAEVLAAVKGKPAAGLSEELQSAIEKYKDAVAGVEGLTERAQRAVQAVLADSELKELWEEGETPEAQEHLKQWQATVADLAARLAS